MPAPNAQLATRIKFLETDLIAACEHKKLGAKKTRDVVFVKQMNAGDEEIGVSVAQIAESIVASIKNITGQKSKVEAPVIDWPEGVKEIVESLQVYIREVYLKIERVKEASGKSSTDFEYALWIGIKLDEEKKEKLSKIPPFDLIQLEELFLKIWQTDNKTVLKEMKIIDFDKLLAPVSQN